MTSKIKLFVSGQKGEVDRRKIPPVVTKVTGFLDKSEDGELFTTPMLASLVGYTRERICEVRRYSPDYSYKAHNTVYWGKPATVAQLKRETEHEGHRRRKAGSGE